MSGFVAVPFLLAVAYVGNPLYGFFICLATAYAALEMRHMLRSGGYVPLSWLLVGTAVLLPLNAWSSVELWPSASPLAVITFLVVASLVALLVRPTSERVLVDWALSLALGLYLGCLMLFFIPLRAAPGGMPGAWVISLMVLSWVCDSSAFFVGGAIGHTRLAPQISPKKSVEGAVAGLAGAAIVGPLLGQVLGLPPLLMAGYGLAIGIGTIVGDLIESLIKRQTGVKDSGVLIPGHGGLLDRMDSLLLCAPVAMFFVYAFAA